MRDSRYRQSRICRVLGNPVVYALVCLLDERGPLTPSTLADAIHRRLQTVSGHRATLRAVDLVRYERRGGRTRYWLKHPGETRRVLAALRALVQTAGRLPD